MNDGVADLGLGVALAEESHHALGLLLADGVASVALVLLGEVDVSDGRAVVADLAGADAACSVAEDERRDDVGSAECDGDDAGAHDSLPDGEGDVLVVVSVVAESA